MFPSHKTIPNDQSKGEKIFFHIAIAWCSHLMHGYSFLFFLIPQPDGSEWKESGEFFLWFGMHRIKSFKFQFQSYNDTEAPLTNRLHQQGEEMWNKNATLLVLVLYCVSRNYAFAAFLKATVSPWPTRSTSRALAGLCRTVSRTAYSR
jgi:hypothetical protein